MSKLPWLLLTTLILLLGAAVGADDPEWEIELLPGDSIWLGANPTGINQDGWISGTAALSSNSLRPVLWRDGGYVDLLSEFPGTEGYPNGQASAINNSGWLCGGVTVGPGRPVIAALWDGEGGEAHIIHPDAADVPGYTFTHSQAMDLNNSGEVAGMVKNFTGGPYRGERAYVWGPYGAPGTLLPIPAGYVSSQALSLNNSGVVAGHSWDGAFDLEACAWLRQQQGDYKLVHIHQLLAAYDPAIVRSFTTYVDDRGRVYGMGQATGFVTKWTWVWHEREGLSFLDTDASVGQVLGGGGHALAGLRGVFGGGGEDAVAWLHETPYLLPQLADHAGHIGVAANARGDVVGYAMFAGSAVWFQGSEAWIARRAHGND